MLVMHHEVGLRYKAHSQQMKFDREVSYHIPTYKIANSNGLG